MTRIALTLIVALLASCGPGTVRGPESARALSPVAVTPAWKPDRRPIVWIWTGPQQWSLDQIDTLWPQWLDKCPLKRKGLGWPAGQNPTGLGAMYYPLDGLKRQAYVRAWTTYRLAHKGSSLAIYGGSTWADEYTTTPAVAGWHWIDFFDSRDWRGMHDGVIVPWINEIVGPDPREWWWDAAGGQGKASITAWMDYLYQRYGVKGGVEAIPMLSPGVVDLDMVRRYPCLAGAPGFIDNPAMGIADVDVHGWHEPHAYIVSVPHGGGVWTPQYSAPQVASLVKRGWIVDCDPYSWDVVRDGYKLAGVSLPAGSM